MKMLYRVSELFDTPVAEGETLEDLFERMDKQGRFDFKMMQNLIVMLIKDAEDR